MAAAEGPSQRDAAKGLHGLKGLLGGGLLAVVGP